MAHSHSHPRPASRIWPPALALQAALITLACAAPAAHAQPGAGGAQQAVPAAVQTYDIAAGPLDEALASFAARAGVSVTIAPALVRGKATRGLQGAHGVREGFARLLAGTGLEAVGGAGGSYVLQVQAAAPQPEAAVLPVTRVVGDGEGTLPRPYAGGQVARGSRLGMLGNADVFETPFSTKAYTAELIRNQGARNVNDMVANDPSIRTSLSATSPLDQASIRGFLNNSDGYLFDGVEGLFAYGNVPVAHYERLEVLKGPAGGLIGASSYGATVGGSFNLVPKRATDAPVRSITLSAQDKSLLGVHVDLGQRFGTGNAWGLRLNVSAEDGKLFDGASRRLVAPQIALDWRGETVRVVLDAGHTARKSSPLFNHWLLQAGQPVPAVPDPRVHSKPAWEVMDMRQNYGLVSGEWDFAPGWTAHARHGQYEEDPPERRYIDQTTLDGQGRVLYTSATSLLWRQSNQVTDLGVRGSFHTGPVVHRLSVSLVSQRQELEALRSRSLPLPYPVSSSIYAAVPVPDPFAFGVPPVTPTPAPALYLNSLAVADTLSLLDDRLHLTLAVRQQRIRKLPYEQRKTTPTVAALYKLGGGVSVYGNYAESLAQGAIAPAGTLNAGEQLAPYLSRQHEFGLKWDRGTHGITAAWFDIRRESAFTDTDNVFKPAGRQRNKGLEVETFGEVLPGLRLLGGIAWIDGRMTRTARGVNQGHKAIGVPEVNVNLGAEYDVAAMPGLTLTGRLIYTGSAYVDLANTQKVPSWHRVDVGARYAMTLDAGRHLTLRAGIANLLDRNYWTIAGRNFISVAPPRTWQLSATVDF